MVLRLKIGIHQLQNKFLSFYSIYWLTRRFSGMYAVAFSVFFVFSVIQNIAPQGLYAISPLRRAVMGGPDNLSRAVAVQVAGYGSEPSQGRSRPYAYSSASGAVYGWPSYVAPVLIGDQSGSFTEGSPIIIYEVKEGETLALVADHFRISTDTLVQANSLSSTELVTGQRLIVLPISGVLHEVGPGDTLETISQHYNVSLYRIETMNGLDSTDLLSSGEKIIVPGATTKTKLSFSQGSSSVQFRMPTVGWNWGSLHRVNAVDIANRCGTPVYASAAGSVLEAVDTGWNNGYGIYILLDHQAGVKTRYGHLSSVFVVPGTSVQQGQLIGAIGKSGKVDGVSGCHLHFEVLGATNPFAK